MFYFSELINKKVVNSSNKTLGKLKDMLFLAEETPTITKLYVKKNNKTENWFITIRQFISQAYKVMGYSR